VLHFFKRIQTRYFGKLRKGIINPVESPWFWAATPAALQDARKTRTGRKRRILLRITKDW